MPRVSTGPYNTLAGPRENVNESTGCNLLTWTKVSKVYNKNIKPLCTKIQTATLTLYCRCLRTTCITRQVFHELSIRIIHCVKVNVDNVISSQLKLMLPTSRNKSPVSALTTSILFLHCTHAADSSRCLLQYFLRQKPRTTPGRAELYQI